MTIPRIALALAFGLVALSAARAQTAQGVPGDMKNFVTQYVSATNARDSARLRSFLYPKSLACITPENKDYYDEMASHIGEPIPPNYKFSVMPVNEGNLKALEGMGQRWTVKPMQELPIDIAVFLGSAFAGEELNFRTICGAAVIVAAVALVVFFSNRPAKPPLGKDEPELLSSSACAPKA